MQQAEIPEDVMKMAREITDEYRQRWHAVRAETRVTDIWSVEDDLHALDIARAIMAERERCAKIAERYEIILDSPESDAYVVAGRIAADVRSQT